MKFGKRFWIIAGIVLLVIVGGIIWNVNRQKNADTGYQTVKVERGTLSATVGATGTVHARQSAVLSWETSGTVKSVDVKLGDNVRADQQLAALDRSTVPQNVILAEADLVSARQALADLLGSDTQRAQVYIDLKDAKKAYEDAADYREFLNNNKITIQEVKLKTKITRFGNRKQVPVVVERKINPDQETIDNADNDLALKKAKYEDLQRQYDRIKDGPNQDDVAAAEARITAAQATLDMALLTAPFGGTITEVDPMPGDQVNAGQTAFRIDDLSNLEVDVEISEVDINSVKVGQPVTLTFDAILGQEYHGEVTKVAQAATLDQGIANFTVTVELVDADSDVKPGMTAAVTVLVKEVKDVLLVPNRAVRVLDGKQVVYVMKNEVPTPVEIRLGATSDTVSQVLGNDLQEGDLIVLNPPTQLNVGPGSGRPGFAQ
jgi:HlyD family secretion protein